MTEMPLYLTAKLHFTQLQYSNSFNPYHADFKVLAIIYTSRFQSLNPLFRRYSF